MMMTMVMMVVVGSMTKEKQQQRRHTDRSQLRNGRQHQYRVDLYNNCC